MDPRLPTAEHILAKILEDRFNVRIGICKFDDHGLLEVYSGADMRKIDIKVLQEEVNGVTSKNLPVKKYILSRKEAEKIVDLRKVPESAKEIRVVDIIGFDKRPCKDDHADNTSEIRGIKITSIERVGKDRYRFLFECK